MKDIYGVFKYELKLFTVFSVLPLYTSVKDVPENVVFTGTVQECDQWKIDYYRKPHKMTDYITNPQST